MIGGEKAIAGTRRWASVEMAEGSSPTFSERISVRDFAVDKKCGTTRDHLGSLCRCNCNIGLNLIMKFGMRADCADRGAFASSTIGPRRRILHRINGYCAGGPNTNILGRGLAGVFESQNDGRILGGLKVAYPGAGRSSDVGPQLPFGVALASDIQSECRDPEPYCRDRQNESERRDWITRRPLPKGFALLVAVSGLFGGLITGIFLLLTRRV